MGIEFSLYHEKSKEFIVLGKSRNDSFQINAELISAFLNRHKWDDNFRILSDSGYLPDREEEGWKCLANWNSQQLSEPPTK